MPMMQPATAESARECLYFWLSEQKPMPSPREIADKAWEYFKAAELSAAKRREE